LDLRDFFASGANSSAGRGWGGNWDGDLLLPNNCAGDLLLPNN
jgi:hypothetical protein